MINNRQYYLWTKNTELQINYCFETFFMDRFTNLGYDAVKRWTQHRNVFTYAKLIFPSKLRHQTN